MMARATIEPLNVAGYTTASTSRYANVIDQPLALWGECIYEGLGHTR